MKRTQHLNLAVSIFSFMFILIFSALAISAEPQIKIDFETQVLPILQNRCFSCHSAPKTDPSGAITKSKGGVQLDSVKGIEMSLHGEVIIAGAPEDSRLYQRTTLPEGDTGIMPPIDEGEPLTTKETDLIRKWIAQGADYGEWTGNQSESKPSTPDPDPHPPTVMPPITALAFSHDGKYVVACSQAGLHIYDFPTLNLQRTIEVSARNIHALAFSPDGDRLAVGGGDPATQGIIEIFSWPEGRSIRSLRAHRDSVTAVAWRDASSLASASLDRRIILWDLPTESPIQQLEGHSRGVSSLCFLNDKERLVSTGVDQSVRVWDVTSGTLMRNMNNHTLPVHHLALRPGTSGLPMIVSAGDDRTVRFWQPTIGRMVKFARLKAAPLDVAWLNNGARIVAACADGAIRLVDPDSVEVTGEIQALKGWAYALAVHPTDGSIVVGGPNAQVRRIIPK
ncbi:hypothetical protein F4009_13480 [Candidatus Poribacteria bacterium]|nr:hypothetical protein [Candidatus Poribacteria bacterium]MYH81487.1 hypothetical protein [Candidatus Poribacteria bacterium]MYK94986.1 hypothetical protein [Candidatus Poribacteria bacterium]